MSISTTSGRALCTRRITGSVAVTGKLAQVWTTLATLVPSTSTCKTARCSASSATMTTDNSGIALLAPCLLANGLDATPGLSSCCSIYLSEGLGFGFDPSNCFWSRNGEGNVGPGGVCRLGATRLTVHKTINSALLFCALLLLKKLPRIG